MWCATDVSAAIGQFFAAAFFLIGLLGGNIVLALIAVFIFFGATGEAQMVRQQELTSGLTVSDVMGTKPRTETVTPYHTFGQVLDMVIHGYQGDFPVADEEGNLVGMLTIEDIAHASLLGSLPRETDATAMTVDTSRTKEAQR